MSVIGLEGFPLVKAGDDLAKMIVETAEKEGASLSDGDVVVIAQKIVSKAEGRIINLKDVVPSKEAEEMARAVLKDPRLVELILRQSKEIVKASPRTLIVKTRDGTVCLNAGIDKSNVADRDTYALLPEDPDGAARKLRTDIMKLTGRRVSVVICDTYSRPFRRGQVEFAIGVAGIKPFKDYRGQRDLFGYVLRVKNVAIVDEIASAAELVMGQGREAIPVAIIKNLNRVEESEASSIRDLNISKQEDLFRGTL